MKDDIIELQIRGGLHTIFFLFLHENDVVSTH